MNILVTGANGQLGNEMRLVAQQSVHKFIFSDVFQSEGQETTILDIINLQAVEEIVIAEKIDAIVNCAGYTNVDAAETNHEMAELLNVKAVENLAVVMKEVRGLLIHISTDYVFGGGTCNIPYREEHVCNPTSVYGSTKKHGEEAIKRAGCKYIIIRTSWMYSEFGKNFVKTIMNLSSEKPQLKVVFDQIGSPTYALDLASAIAVIVEDYKRESFEKIYSKTGIYHYSNEGVCSWYDFAKMIAEFSGNTECDIQPCHSNEFSSLVRRPSYSVLDKTKIKCSFGVSIPYWTDSLKLCIKKMHKL